MSDFIKTSDRGDSVRLNVSFKSIAEAEEEEKAEEEKEEEEDYEFHS